MSSTILIKQVIIKNLSPKPINHSSILNSTLSTIYLTNSIIDLNLHQKPSNPNTMNNFTLKLALIIILFSNIGCFASDTKHSLKISDQYISIMITKIPDTLIDQNTLHNTSLTNKDEILTMSILEFIKEHTDPYKKKNEAQGSWIKSTKWIKDPNWIKKELV